MNNSAGASRQTHKPCDWCQMIIHIWLGALAALLCSCGLGVLTSLRIHKFILSCLSLMSAIHDWRVILISLKFHPALLLNTWKSYSTILILHEMTRLWVKYVNACYFSSNAFNTSLCASCWSRPLHHCNSLSHSYVVQSWCFVMALSIVLRRSVVYRASPSQEGGWLDWSGWSIMFFQQLPVVF